MAEAKLRLELKKKHYVQFKDTRGKKIITIDSEEPIYKFNAIFYSITDNFQIIIDQKFTLNILVEEIIPNNKDTIISFSESGIEGILQIKMYLFPLDIYILDYFFYCTFGIVKKIDNGNQHQLQEIQNIADLIASEIILYDPNANQRQLDSLYFSSAILLLFREASHVSEDILGLVPRGVIYPLLFKNKHTELKKIFLDEFRDSYTEIIHQLKRVELMEDEILKENEMIRYKKMIKFLHLRTYFFIAQLEKILFEFIIENDISTFLNAGFGLGEQKLNPSLAADYYSIIQFLTRLDNISADSSKKSDENICKSVYSINKQVHESLIVILHKAGKNKITEKQQNSTKNQSNNNSPTKRTSHRSSNLSSPQDKSQIPINQEELTDFEHIFLEVDLHPDWLVTKNDKKDQILLPGKEGSIFFKQKFLLFKVRDSNIEIKIPYKIIDSFTEINPPDYIKKPQNTLFVPTEEAIEGSERTYSDNRNSMTESSVYIYDGVQLYTFLHLGQNVEKFLLELEKFTRKKRSDSFRDTLRKKWKKDQIYVLQTESIKRLVKKTGSKVSQILSNLLDPDTYTLSDIIILQNSCIQREDVAIDTLNQLKKIWTKYIYTSGANDEKLQLIKITKKIFTERVAVSSKRLFKELMDWIEKLQNSYFILIEWTEVGQKANKMYQKMKNYSMINVHQIPPINAADFFNEQLIKPYLVKYAQMPEG